MNPKINLIGGLVPSAVESGGRLIPISPKWDKRLGVAMMNPSIYNDGGKLLSCVRCVNYTMHHSQDSRYPHWAGPLQYVHPENDVRLATENFIAEFDDQYNLIKFDHIDMLDLGPRKWEFHGLEDGRLFRWNGKLYICGVRRDTTDNGQGRMELSEIELASDSYMEVSRVRIPSTGNDDSYCEKNWMPILDRPYEFIKWTSPTEVVRVDLSENLARVSSNVSYSKNYPYELNVRGGSQVVSYKDYYISIGHTVNLWKPYSGEKDATYYSHFLIWDKDFNLIKVSEGFKFLNYKIEFCCGLTRFKNDLVISFSVMDNEAYLLTVNPDWLIQSIL